MEDLDMSAVAPSGGRGMRAAARKAREFLKEVPELQRRGLKRAHDDVAQEDHGVVDATTDINRSPVVSGRKEAVMPKIRRHAIGGPVGRELMVHRQTGTTLRTTPIVEADGRRAYEYSCWHCNGTFETVKELMAHVKTTHQNEDVLTRGQATGAREFCCDVCGLRFSTSNRLVYHRQAVHSDEQGYECPIEGCGQTFRSTAAVKRHIGAAHGARLDQPGRIECPLCSALFATDRDRETHVEEAHAPGEGTHCQKCARTFDTNYQLRYHQHKAHGVYIPSSGIRVNCPYCGKKFNSRESMDLHVNNACPSLRADAAEGSPRTRPRSRPTFLIPQSLHLPNTDIPRFPYRCEICEALFKTVRERTLHETKVHCERTLQCPVCDAWFKTAQHLRRHYDEQHGLESDSAFKCGFCPKVFRRKRNLEAHVRDIHYEAPPLRFQCPVCAELFTRMDALNVHRDLSGHWPEIGYEKDDAGLADHHD